MNTAVLLLAIYGLNYIVRNSDGPFDLIIKARRWLINNTYVGSFFFKLLECPVCSGFWCGLAIYLIAIQPIKLSESLLWALTGSAVCLILDGLTSWFHQE